MVNVLIKPLITEKMTDVSEKTGKYGFVVDINANKIQIASAISFQDLLNTVCIQI